MAWVANEVMPCGPKNSPQQVTCKQFIKYINIFRELDNDKEHSKVC